MALFVHIIQECMEDAEHHGYNDALVKIKEKTEAEQNISTWEETFPPPYIVKKKFGDRQGRLIAARCDLNVDGDDHTVIVVLACITRANRKYEDFYKNSEEYGENHFQPILKGLDLESIIRKRTQNKDLPPEKQPLQTNEELYLKAQNTTNIQLDDVFICETKEWVEAIEKNKLHEFDIDEIREELYKLSQKSACGDLKENDFCYLPCGMKIHYKWDEEKRQIILLSLQRDKEEVCNTNTSYKSFREYPAYLTIDKRLFCELEKDTYGNLALSEEEKDILEPKSKPLSFPMFINGRAGSGKSTILQYLFAKFYYRYLVCDRPFINPPAYFACNEELIHKAREFVSAILINNPAYGDELIKRNIDTPEFQCSFKVFKTYLKSLLKGDEVIKQFPENKYVDYARFVKLWEEKFGKTRDARKNYGPDISWHVIRTFIKGMSAVCEMEKDEFDRVPKKQKSVSKDLFLTVYSEVWEKWYKGITDRETGEGLWDDQDLVLYLLDKGRFDSEESKFPGIFCDEAQDFTQIEIIAFFKMSVFSERKIFPHQISLLPFVFAGDEFQTLNPTGFSWDAVKGMFHEKFIRSLCASANSVELVANDLLNNYRSLSEIVRFSNSVQLLRSVRFEKKNIKPQNMWSSGQGTRVAYFNKDSIAFWDALKEREEIQLIVPCHAGEELEYIKNDAILKEKVHIDPQTGVTTPNVLSTVKAKGLEYPCVAVYGFGEALQDQSLIKWQDDHKWPDDGIRMTMEYFLNRLYVAVSRPKDQLYLVDSKEGIDRLWSFANSSDSLNLLVTKSKLKDEWTSRITYWIPGTQEMLARNYTMDFAWLAKNIEENAPDQKFTAANYYKLIGDMQSYNRCRAEGFCEQKKWSEAAKLYKQISKYREAGNCYWEISDWDNMVDVLFYVPDLAIDPRYVAAKALNCRDKKEAVSKAIELICSKIEQNIYEFQTDPWRKTITTLERRALDSSGEMLLKNSQIIIKLGEQGFAEMAEEAAKKAVSGRFYGESIRLFEQAGKTSDKLYKLACAHTTKYPEKLVKLSELGESYYKDIVEEYDNKNNIENFTESQKLVVAKALLLQSDRKNDFTEVVLKMREPKLISQIKANTGRKKDDAMLSIFIHYLSEIRKAQVLEDSDTPEYVADLVLRLKNEEGLVISILARCHGESFAIAADDIQSKVHQYINNFVDAWKANKDKIRDKISIVEAGCAIEKFGFMKAAMDFYETAEKDQNDPNDSYLKERILAVRRKRLEYHKKDKTDQQYREELDKIDNDAKSIGKKLSDIPELPLEMEWKKFEDNVKNTFLNYSKSKDSAQTPNFRSSAAPDAMLTKSASSDSTKLLNTSIIKNTPKVVSQSSSSVDSILPTAEASPMRHLYKKCDFKIGKNNEYKIEWRPKRNKVIITIDDEKNEKDGISWTIDDAGIYDDDSKKTIPLNKKGAIRLSETPLSVVVCPDKEKNHVGLMNDETGVTYVFHAE